MQLHRCVLSDVQRKSGLAHRRTSRNENQIRRLQTGRLSVQIGETGGKACDDTVIFGGGLDLAEYVDDDLVDRFEIFPAFFFDQIKDAALCLIQDRFQRFTIQITRGADIVSDLDQTAKGGLFCYDSSIRLGIG